MSEPNFDLSKIQSEKLREFAREGSNERMSVLIELAAAPPQVRVGERSWGKGSARPMEFEPPDEASVRVRMDQMFHRLADILGEQPVRFEMAEAFVADVTPEQLRQISRLAHVGDIRPNRTHRIR
jgi:hypothetical protein